MRDDARLEKTIENLLADPQYEGHPLQAALAELFGQYKDGVGQLERLTSISDGYQSVLRERNQSLAERYRKQIRQLHRIVRISDHYQEMLRDVNEKLKIASTQDHLTGLPNRRLMLDRLLAEAAQVKRSKPAFSVALMDVDDFKSVNDVYGHDVGDKALILLARALTGGLRAYDVCSRWGGEEFLVFLPESSLLVAEEVANRLRQRVEEMHSEEMPAGRTFTISGGVAEYQAPESLESCIRRADQALYMAKRTGRNCVIAAGPPVPPELA